MSTVQTNNSSCDQFCCDFSSTSNIVDAFLFITIYLWAVCGNLIVFLLYKQHRVLRNTTNVFIISLSASDMIVALLSLPLTFGTFLCKMLVHTSDPYYLNLYKVCDMLPSVMSIYSLTLIAVDRACAVSLPFLHRKYVNTRSASIAVVVMWIVFTSLVCLLFAMDMNSFTWLAILMAYAVPVTIMIVSYAVVGCVAKKHAKDINKLERTKCRFVQTDIIELNEEMNIDNHHQSIDNIDNNTVSNRLIDTDSNESIYLPHVGCKNRTDSLKDKSLVPPTLHWLPTPHYQKKGTINIGVRCIWREIKAALKLSFILSCFVISWTPFIAINIEYLMGQTPDPIVVKYFKLLHYSNSAFNPMLYIMLNKTWRAAFKMTVCCRKDRRRLALKSMAGW